MIQQLRNAVVAPTGMGKNYGRIMTLLRQTLKSNDQQAEYCKGMYNLDFSWCEVN